MLLPLIPHVIFSAHIAPARAQCLLVPSEDIPGMVKFNPNVAVPVLKAFLVPSAESNDLLRMDAENVLVNQVEPTLNGFDVWGRLLRDDELASGQVNIKRDLLPRFITRCISVLDVWEREERERSWDDERSSEGSGRWERGLVIVRILLSFLLSSQLILFSCSSVGSICP